MEFNSEKFTEKEGYIVKKGIEKYNDNKSKELAETINNAIMCFMENEGYSVMQIEATYNKEEGTFQIIRDMTTEEGMRVLDGE